MNHNQMEGMGFWLLVLVGGSVGWAFGSGVGATVGVVIGALLSQFFHQVQYGAILWGIHGAAGLGNVGRVRYLLRKNPSLVNARDAKGRTPLDCAIAYFELGVVEELLRRGADVNAQDKNGATPLHLLAAGVPPNPPPNPPRSVLLTESGLQGIHLRIAERLLAQGADTHARLRGAGWTPLETAKTANTHYMVKLLTDYDARVRR